MSSELTENILFLISEKKPGSVKELSDLVKHTYNLTENEILTEILKMQSKGLIKLNNSEIEPFRFREYLASSETIWFWIIIIVGAVVALLFFVNSETTYPLIYVRNVFGLLFILFLPGYALMRILFPINLAVRASNDQVHSIQRIALKHSHKYCYCYSNWNARLLFPLGPKFIYNCSKFTCYNSNYGDFSAHSRISSQPSSIQRSARDIVKFVTF